ncbi:site-specific integrase [Candidatus Binatia bacterium]|nr:site-specific integrase [Candidatus Binatia bacterium]
MGELLTLSVPRRRRLPRAERCAKLTKRTVDGLKPDPSGKDVWLWDLDVRGFGVRVLPSGKVVYCCQYRDLDGRTRRYKLGQHGPLTPEQARTLAQQVLGKVAMGENPSVERRARRAAARAKRASTVAHVVDAYMLHIARTAKASTQKGFRALAEYVIKARWGTLPADALTRDMLQGYLVEASGTPTHANRALALLGAAYRRAGLPSPTVGVERNREQRRDRYLSEPELARLGAALKEAETVGTVPVEAVWATKLLLLTGCRRGEICGLTWNAVDLDAGVLRLRDAKAGPRLVPLPSAAVDLLRSLPRIGDFVIPGPRAAAPMHGDVYLRHWQVIRNAAGLPDVHVHDLRHTVGTFAGAADVGAQQIRHMLGHASSSVGDRYVSANMPKLREAADRTTAGILAALEGNVDGREGDPER